MMATEAVQPLKIVKNSSPSKPARPLSEIASTEQRRNSPSFNQSTKKVLLQRESSPFDSSPSQQRFTRGFWEDRATLSPGFNSENSPDRSITPEVSKRRSSIENLKKASRVKNSSMYARETKDNYDPSSSPVIERPLNNRPWGGQLQNNVFTRYDSIRKENNPISRSPTRPVHYKSGSMSDIPNVSSSNIPAPSSLPDCSSMPSSPRREAPSPIRSSMAANSRFAQSPSSFDPENDAWSDDDQDGVQSSTPRAQPRHAKSVTFGTAPEINEYEAQTPEPSSVASGSREGSYDSYDDDDEDEDDSFERNESPEHDDSFDASLEDIDKTPVVLPEDWQHMLDSARAADDGYSHVFDDDHGSSPAPSATPINGRRPEMLRADSNASDGSYFRPLPPTPGFASPNRGRVESPRGLAAAAERASSLQRALPSPPRAASVSKDEILRMREATMSLEDRMGLLALQESLAEVNGTQADAGLRLEPAAEIAEANSAEDMYNGDENEHVAENDAAADLSDFDVAPAISRESILRNVKSRRYDDFTDHDFADDDTAMSSPERDYAELANLDPDVAIPSRENSTQFFGEEAPVTIKQEDESFVDLDAIPTLQVEWDAERSPSATQEHERDSSVLRHEVSEDEVDGDDDDDKSSRYSSPMSELAHERVEEQGALPVSVEPTTEETFSTPLEDQRNADHARRMSLPLLDNFLGTDDYDFGLESYITPSPPLAQEERPLTAPETQKVSVLNPPKMFTPNVEQGLDVESVEPSFATGDDIPERDSFESALHDSMTEEPLPSPEPVIPERKATIKTQGKLRARPSATPADLRGMIAQRRQVSHEVPPMPDMYRTASQTDSEITESGAEDSEHDIEDDASPEEDDTQETPAGAFEGRENRRQSRKQLKLDLDLPIESLGEGEGLGLGLMEEFDRVIESQKKGYLMRQNTKVIVASNRDFSGETPSSTSPPMSPNPGSIEAARSSKGSPRKSSAGEKWLTAEPWNGKTRRKSTRKSSGRRSNVGVAPAPPLPGQDSALGTVDEYMGADDTDDSVERGRLFVKVVGVKELDLPLPRNDRLYFQLTLDNGLHCVTTANIELGKSAPIGQEFELVVLNDLEFQLTLTTKLPPAPKPQQAASSTAPSSPTKSAKSGSVFSRLLSSPKKRAAEKERKEREDAEVAERQRQAEEKERKRLSAKPTPWDLMRELVDGRTGSFARAYVSLKSHEQQCFGRQLTVDVPCFNEWALEKDASVVSSVRSKRNNGNLAFGRTDGTIRRPPYTIGQLELQLLFIPKPKNATDDAMPKSMSSAVREMKAAEQVKEVSWEGCLSQQGGDCPYWRRRFFRLQGTKLTAFHEATHQPRATINLSKASKLIDDKSALVADPTSGNPSAKKRRKSAFAEDDDGYQFVEDGFRIRFANGETIDFYADNVQQKEGWMKALSQSVGKPATASKQPSWTDVVLAKERAEGRPSSSRSTESETDRKTSNRTDASAGLTSKGTSNIPVKREPSTRPPPPPKDQVRSATPPMNPRTGHRERSQVKSMIF